jgi:Domain of unknown function (DUF4262)
MTGEHDEFLRHRFLHHQDDLIARYGWAVTAVLPTPTDPCTPFAYTVGLTERAQPELVIAGLDPLIAQALLNDLAQRVIDHSAQLTHGQRLTDLIAGYDAALVDGPITQDLYPGTAIGRYGADRVALRQIVWPDRDGRFPWDPGYAYPPQAQPLIGRP